MHRAMKIVREDITRLHVDAIVNAANTALIGGGGVDGAIHDGAGPELLEACLKLGGCETGDVKVTPGFNLPAKYIFHAVGPIWHYGRRGEAEKLRSCYRRAMELANELKIRSIAFPAISCGAFGYPIDEAAAIAISTVGKAPPCLLHPRKNNSSGIPPPAQASQSPATRQLHAALARPSQRAAVAHLSTESY